MHIPLLILPFQLFNHLLLYPPHAALYILIVSFSIDLLLKHGQLLLYPNRERLIRMLHVTKRLLQVLTPILVHNDAVLDLSEPPWQLLEHADLRVGELQLVLGLRDRPLQTRHIRHHVVVGLLHQVHCREERHHQAVYDTTDAVLEPEPVQLVLGAPWRAVGPRLLVQVTEDTRGHQSMGHVVVQVSWGLRFF
jgi:hypothetical protein